MNSSPEWPEGARLQLDRFVVELQRWGRSVNLVGSTDPAALERHLRDALAAAPYLKRGARLVDLGSGAGLPGIPLAIVRPDVEVVLVEIRERRVHFLRHVARALDLTVRVERRSIEEVPPTSDRFDIACLRAVAQPAQSLSLGRPWVRPGGEVWIWSSERAALPAGDRVGEISLGEGGWILRAHASVVSRGTPR